MIFTLNKMIFTLNVSDLLSAEWYVRRIVMSRPKRVERVTVVNLNGAVCNAIILRLVP